MIDLKQNTILREIPQNLLVDPRVEHLAQSLQQSVNDMLEWVDKINYRDNLEKLPDEIIEHLLWESHITWSEGLALASSREQKINLIHRSEELHRLKGTPAAIELVCSLLNVNSKMEEWFEYEGEPYHFKLKLRITDKGLNENTVKLLEALVMEYKNVRSYLEAINIYLTSVGHFYTAATTTTHEKISVYPYVITNVESQGYLRTVAAAHNIHEKISIYPKGGNKFD